MLKVYVVRHGETEWNAEKRTQGRLDSKLTEKGKRDANLLGERLKGVNFTRIFSSPSNRTMETAKRVKGTRSTPIETDERLYEIDLGAWQGKTEEEIKTQYPEQFHFYWNEPQRFENILGENFLDVKKRIEKFFNELERETPTGNLLVITHGVVIKSLYSLCRNADVEKIWDPPFIHGTSLTVIEIHDGVKKIMLEGCISHSS
ncbi:probable phosphoglycerate mutase [Mesobacillus persicus]|uniref:Probable phosphoglycerate mutase n=1 Tax=Mesobacillus persicus TaxID=930146 RepID=A0A1H7VMV5_9BACI|nr:histidine phosphatase family protein [Mesobacillus persicus]SEM10185.1 probable phosphoglycerate mutase [Mesobacillus persicus]